MNKSPSASQGLQGSGRMSYSPQPSQQETQQQLQALVAQSAAALGIEDTVPEGLTDRERLLHYLNEALLIADEFFLEDDEQVNQEQQDTLLKGSQADEGN